MLKKQLIEKGIVFSNTFNLGASFLFGDGSFLNVKEQDSKLTLIPCSCHSTIDKFIIDNKLLSEEVIDEYRKKHYNQNSPFYITSNNHRMLRYTDNVVILNNALAFKFENCFIDLPPNDLTKEQYDALTLWLDDVHYKGPREKISVSLEETYTSYNLKEYTTDDIIKEIKKLYNIKENNYECK